MRRINRILCIILVAGLGFMLSGCSSREELGNVAVITGFYLEFSHSEQSYLLLAESADFSNYEKSSALSSEWLQGKGKTVSEAFVNLQKNAPKDLYFSHAKILLLGKGFRQVFIRETVDYLMNQPDINPDLLIVMTDITSKELEQADKKALCKTVFEFMEKDEIPKNAKLYQLYQEDESSFSFTEFSFSKTGILNQ